MRIITILSGFAIVLATQQASAITFDFDYSKDTNGFFNDTSRRTLLEQAGSFFENSLNDTLNPITSSGGDQFNAVLIRPDTGASETINGFSVATDTLTVFAGGRNLGGSLGLGGPGGFGASGSQAFLDNAFSRGEGDGTQGAVEGATATDFAPWGGGITFNTSTTNWYFDDDVSTDDVPFGQSDFFSIALHELGHLLGIGTSDSWENFVSGSNFTGPASSAANGGNVSLSGDVSHWADGTTSNGLEAAMDPIITQGDRKRFTELDLAGLTDVGWEVTPIPVPPAMILFGSGLIGLLGFRKKVNQ